MNHKILYILLSLLLLVGCKSTHDPDSVEIETESWNRSKMLNGIFSITVRGESTNTESFGIQVSEPDRTPKGFESVNQIWRKAIATTCPSGMKQVISKKEEVRELQMPGMSLTQLDIIRIPGMVFAEPWIYSVVQCSNSEATQDEINQKFYRDKIEQDKTMLNLMENMSKKLETDGVQ